MPPLADDYYSPDTFKSRLEREIKRDSGDKNSRIGFRDTGVATLWDNSAAQAFDEELRLMRDHQLAGDSIDSKIAKRWNDHRNIKFENGQDFDPIAITPPKDDMVTLLGMNHLAKLGTGQILPAFSHYAAGTGTTTEHLSDTKLVGELPPPRVSVVTDGYREDVGSAMRFLGRFSTTIRNAVITEGAVFNAPLGGVPLFRTVFTEDDFINHQQYKTFFSLSQTVSMISVT